MKSTLLSLLAHVVGDPIILTGQAVRVTGTGIRKAGEYLEVGGAIVEVKGREIKAGYQARAQAAAVDEELADHEKAVQTAQKKVAAHMGEIEKLESALAKARAKLSRTLDGGAEFVPADPALVPA